MAYQKKLPQFTKEKKDKFLLLFRMGYNETDACTYIGVTPYALNTWISKKLITKEEIAYNKDAIRNLSVDTIASIIRGEEGGVNKKGIKTKSRMEKMVDPRVSLEAAKWWLEYKHAKEFRKISGLNKFLEGVDIAQLIVEANRLDKKQNKKLEEMKEANIINITPEKKDSGN